MGSSSGEQEAKVPAGTEPRDRAPLLMWAVPTVATVVTRLLATGGPDELSRWDALHRWESIAYLDAADLGVARGGAGVLPVYPLLVRALTSITGERITTAVLVSYAAGAVAAWLLWDWLELREQGRPVRIVALALLLAFPFSFVLYGVVGPDSLGLALVLGSLVLAERRRLLEAAFVAAVAVSTILAALALLPALTVLVYEHVRSTGSLRASDRGEPAASSEATGSLSAAGAAAVLGVVVPLLGIVAAAVYAAWSADDAFAPWRTDGQLAGVSFGLLRAGTWLRGGWLFEDAPWTWFLSRAVQAGILYGALAGSWWVKRRFGLAYALFTIVVVLTALLSVPEIGATGRRLVLLFPFAGLGAEWLVRQPKPLGMVVIGVMGASMLWIYGLYVRGIGLPYW